MASSPVVPPVYGGVDVFHQLRFARDGVAEAFFSHGASQTLSSLAASSIGGPFVVGFLTPQRNAMTLAAKDVTSTYLGLYGKVFQNGLLKSFRGGARPTLCACPQFTAIGPVYLGVERHSHSALLGVVVASTFESLLSFSAQRGNARVQFNADRPAGKRLAIDGGLTGPGFTCHVLRNAFGMGGIRLLTPFAHKMIEGMPGFPQLGLNNSLVVADLISSIFASTLSMPFNHIFSWCCCTPELNAMSITNRAKAQALFIISNYKEQGLKLLGRDLCIRISYGVPLYTLYRAIERHIVG